MPPNRLALETSPYLRQHSHNPVDWYPWGEEAFEKARRERRPIFLSIGYSACHWCHVMERESFEDAGTAAFLNEHFVSVKVDREERPDVDAYYMRAVMLMTGSGGWPLSVFLTPELAPFYGGTYFPPEARWGVPSFRAVLEGVAEAFAARRSEVEGMGDQLGKAVESSFLPAPGEGTAPDGRTLVDAALEAVLGRYDGSAGGFGGAPKFAQPPLLTFLLEESLRRGDGSLRAKVLFTLRKMADGGLRDQVGGGFHRYCVDAEWRVPHYEKMLYDNALLASLYFRAYELTEADDLRQVALGVMADLRASMAAPGGGFVAALDADSEGEEGRFYLWSLGELEEVLGADAGWFASIYGIGPGGDLDSRTLHKTCDWTEGARRAGLTEEAFRGRLGACMAALRARREKRAHPGVDAKVLTDWNALTAQAFLDGYRATGEEPLLKVGLATLEAIWSSCWDGKTLHHVWDGREAKVGGFLADYAYLAKAEWRAFEVTGEPGHAERTGLLLRAALERFRRNGAGPFFDAPPQSGSSAPPAPVRDTEDGVLPSPLFVLASLLWVWERAAEDAAARRALEELLSGEAGALRGQPGAQPNLAALAASIHSPPIEVVVAGPTLDTPVRELLGVVRKASHPHIVSVPYVADRADPALEERLPILRGRRNTECTRAYLCVGGACLRPVTSPEELRLLLEEAAGGAVSTGIDPRG
jgi:uncharacterized protein YyaL (SSP411 family)